MEVYYRREIQHNYLIIEPDACQGWSYEVKMLLHNPIEGLLKFRMKLVDGEQQFFYEITSKQPLSRVLENRSITAEEIRKLVVSLSSVLNKIEPFLLMPNQILLQAEYIYLEPESFQVYFCLVPGRQADFSKDLQELLYYLLKKVNHQNQESVVLAYGLYQETQKENYGISNLMRFLNVHSDVNEKWTEEQEMACLEESWESPEYNYDRYKTSYDTSYKASYGMRNMEQSEQEERKEGKDDNSIKNSGQRKELLCLFLWIGIFCGIGITYFWRGSEYMWQRKEILLVLVGISALISAVLMYSKTSGKRTQESEKLEEEKTENAKIDIEKKNIIRRTDTKNRKPDLEKQNKIKADDTKKENLKEEKWQILFQEEQSSRKNADENVLQTTILPMTKRTEEGHYLMSLQDGYENILLSYFPFIIGKAEHMADYVIPKSSISRMHVKIERTEEGYQITDLNSTNGTWVGEHQLEANETFPLKENDKIRLSDLVFCFK